MSNFLGPITWQEAYVCHLRVDEDLIAKTVEAEEMQVSLTLASHVTTLGYNYTSFTCLIGTRYKG